MTDLDSQIAALKARRDRPITRAEAVKIAQQYGGGGGSASWASLAGKPSTFPPDAHTHAEGEVTGLTAALAGKQPLATVLTNTTAAFTTAQETKLAGVATAATANAADAALRDRATHTGAQAISTVTGLQTALDAKQATLVSATNIKTVNGTSLLGSGDLAVAGSSSVYYGHLQADYTLTSQTAAQKLFNWSAAGALTLPTGVYRFTARIHLTTMSATSGNGAFHLLGAGTAALSRIFYQVVGIDNSNPTTTTTRGGSASVTQNSLASMVAAGPGSGLVAEISGAFDVTTAGTIIPSIALVTAAAAVVKTGSHFTCERIGDTGAATSSGWS